MIVVVELKLDVDQLQVDRYPFHDVEIVGGAYEDVVEVMDQLMVEVVVGDSYLYEVVAVEVSQNVAAAEMDDVMVAVDDSLDDEEKALRVMNENGVKGDDVAVVDVAPAAAVVKVVVVDVDVVVEPSEVA